MRTTLLLLVLPLIGCPSLTAATPDPLPDFHSYVNPNEFCADANLGLALGFREGNLPWVDELLCANGDGVHVVSATKNGSDVKVDSTWTTSVAERGTQYIWHARTSGSMYHISNDGLLESCPDKTKPLAIVATDSLSDGSFGAYIADGEALCVEGNDLVMRGHIGKDRPALKRWSGFTPLL